MRTRSEIFQSIAFENCGEILSMQEVESFEAAHEIKLSDDYRRFLAKINGGCPYPKNLLVLQNECLNSNDSSEELFEINELFALTSTEENRINITTLTKHLMFSRCPDTRSLIMIGSSSGLNNLYLSISDQFYGHIYLGALSFGMTKDDDSSNQTAINDIYKDLYIEDLYIEDRVASSFSAFLEMLEEER